MSQHRILVLNGPNLSRLGKREPAIYGHTTLEEINVGIKKAFPDIAFDFFQTEDEGELLEKLFQVEDEGDALGYCSMPAPLPIIPLPFGTPSVPSGRLW